MSAEHPSRSRPHSDRSSLDRTLFHSTSTGPQSSSSKNLGHDLSFGFRSFDTTAVRTPSLGSDDSRQSSSSNAAAALSARAKGKTPFLHITPPPPTFFSSTQVEQGHTQSPAAPLSPVRQSVESSRASQISVHSDESFSDLFYRPGPPRSNAFALQPPPLLFQHDNVNEEEKDESPGLLGPLLTDYYRAKPDALSPKDQGSPPSPHSSPAAAATPFFLPSPGRPSSLPPSAGSFPEPVPFPSLSPIGGQFNGFTSSLGRSTPWHETEAAQLSSPASNELFNFRPKTSSFSSLKKLLLGIPTTSSSTKKKKKNVGDVDVEREAGIASGSDMSAAVAAAAANSVPFPTGSRSSANFPTYGAPQNHTFPGARKARSPPALLPFPKDVFSASPVDDQGGDVSRRNASLSPNHASASGTIGSGPGSAPSIVSIATHSTTSSSAYITPPASAGGHASQSSFLLPPVPAFPRSKDLSYGIPPTPVPDEAGGSTAYILSSQLVTPSTPTPPPRRSRESNRKVPLRDRAPVLSMIEASPMSSLRQHSHRQSHFGDDESEESASFLQGDGAEDKDEFVTAEAGRHTLEGHYGDDEYGLAGEDSPTYEHVAHMAASRVALKSSTPPLRHYLEDDAELDDELVRGVYGRPSTSQDGDHGPFGVRRSSKDVVVSPELSPTALGGSSNRDSWLSGTTAAKRRSRGSSVKAYFRRSRQLVLPPPPPPVPSQPHAASSLPFPLPPLPPVPNASMSTGNIGRFRTRSRSEASSARTGTTWSGASAASAKIATAKVAKFSAATATRLSNVSSITNSNKSSKSLALAGDQDARGQRTREEIADEEFVSRSDTPTSSELHTLQLKDGRRWSAREQSSYPSPHEEFEEEDVNFGAQMDPRQGRTTGSKTEIARSTVLRMPSTTFVDELPMSPISPVGEHTPILPQAGIEPADERGERAGNSRRRVQLRKVSISSRRELLLPIVVQSRTTATRVKVKPPTPTLVPPSPSSSDSTPPPRKSHSRRVRLLSAVEIFGRTPRASLLMDTQAVDEALERFDAHPPAVFEPSPASAYHYDPAAPSPMTAMQIMQHPLEALDVLTPAQVMFFLGFVLGPWTWVLGGWMLSANGRIPAKDREGIVVERPVYSRRQESLGPDSPVRIRSRPSSQSASGSGGSPSRYRPPLHSQWNELRRTITEDDEDYYYLARNPSYLPSRSTLVGSSMLARVGRFASFVFSLDPHPERSNWVWRCRVAALISGTLILVASIIAVIVAARGHL